MRKTVWIRIVTCWEGWECRRSLGHWASQRGKDFTQSMHDQHRAAGWLRKDISSRERGGLTWRGGRNWKPTLPTSRFYLFALGSSNNTIPSDTMFEVVFPRNVSESALTSSWSFETARSEAQIRRNSSCCRNSLRSSSYLTVCFFLEELRGIGWRVSNHLIWWMFCYSNFIDEKTEVQWLDHDHVRAK